MRILALAIAALTASATLAQAAGLAPVSLAALPLVAAMIEAQSAVDIQPAVVRNSLTEAFSRMERPNPRPYSRLYTGVRGGSLQPEVLHFEDTQYGTHIWRLTYTWKGYTFAHNHINRSPWNRNGSKVGLISNRRFVPYWYNSSTDLGDPHTYLMDTDGNNFINIDFSGAPMCQGEGTRFRFFIWDRENPDYTYFPGKDGLYRYDVTNPGIFQKIADLPNVDRVKNCYSYPSEDNIVMLIDDLAGAYPSPNMYFIDLNKPMGTPGQVTSYPTALGVTWPGHDQTTEKSFHDIYFTRRSDRSYSFNFGPVAAVGETIFFIAPFDGNPANIALWYDSAGGANAPYHSHPAWGPNGDRTAYFGERYPYGDNHWGLHVADDSAREHVRTLGWYANNLFSGGHIAWDGYDPDFIFCAPGGLTLEKPLFRAWLSKPDNNAEGFVNTYTDNSTYQGSPRPAQSPDATKAFYHSTMLETGNGYADSYIAVARFPFPAANLRMSEGSSVLLSWDPPAFHRETKGYHVYRSIGTMDHFVEITGAAISGTSFTDAQGFPSGKAFYAVTTEEWSGLESRELSNVLEVVRSGSSYSVSGARGPGLTGFDTSAPAAPENLQVTNVEAGVNELSWTQSSDPGLWYYNIYYSVEGTPQPIPERRAASVPRGRSAYIDWQARTDAAGYYLVTAVDRQGNESGVTPVTPPNAPELAPIGSRSIPAGQTLEFTVEATDADGDELQYSAVGE